MLAGMGCVLFFSCDLFNWPFTPPGYYMPRPARMMLGKKVNEISGIYYLSPADGLLAITDDKQKIFRITTDGKVSDYFEQEIGRGTADYEDIVKVGLSIYILVSNGSIKEVHNSDSGLVVQTYPPPLSGKSDFETLYYDSTAKGLIALCKKCENEKGKKIRTAYRFDLATKKFDPVPFYTIRKADVDRHLKDGAFEFDPSAAAIHPLQDTLLYILSSAGNLLVVTNLRGKVQGAYRLNELLYPQAEGITFAPNGDMYVSNEAKLGTPTLLKIAYHPSEKTNK